MTVEPAYRDIDLTVVDSGVMPPQSPFPLTLTLTEGSAAHGPEVWKIGIRATWQSHAACRSIPAPANWDG
jgi:hypothetical protein